MQAVTDNEILLAHQLCPDYPACREEERSTELLMGAYERNIYQMGQASVLRQVCALLRLDLCDTPEALVEALQRREAQYIEDAERYRDLCR